MCSVRSVDIDVCGTIREEEEEVGVFWGRFRPSVLQHLFENFLFGILVSEQNWKIIISDSVVVVIYVKHRK